MVKYKKILEAFLVIALVLFSFFYTDKVVSILEENDPIMKKINEEKGLFEEASINATIEDNKLIPGYNGLTVDTRASFKKMKNYGSYNASLLVFQEVEPTISSIDYYDKYIISGNGFSTSVSLVFALDSATYLEKVLNILTDTNTVGTFFLDGTIIDNNKDLIKGFASTNHELEVLSYNNGYNEELFKKSLDNIKILTLKDGKYCYASYDNKEVLDLCNKLNLHTIIPTLKLENNIYTSLKGNLRSGSIISIKVTENNLKELPVVVNYIKQRGFTLVTLDQLLNEARNEK